MTITLQGAYPRARHRVLPLRRPDSAVVYVGHPISGIRMSRIIAMEARIRDLLPDVEVLLPMRSTHLTRACVGGNEYPDGVGLFSDTRHFTLQNRVDALHRSDAVLLNYDLADDEGSYRISCGMPFDLGWARAVGKPVVAVLPHGNPNASEGLVRDAALVPDLASAVRVLAPHLAPRTRDRAASHVEIFDFGGCAFSPDLIAALGEADARKASGACAAIISVIPDGRANPNWHGQVKEVSDWLLPSMEEAMQVAATLGGAAT